MGKTYNKRIPAIEGKTLERNGRRAVALRDGDTTKFLVLAGSKVERLDRKIGKPAQVYRQELVDSGAIVDGALTRNVMFRSLAMACAVLLGQTTRNGRKFWRVVPEQLTINEYEKLVATQRLEKLVCEALMSTDLKTVRSILRDARTQTQRLLELLGPISAQRGRSRGEPRPDGSVEILRVLQEHGGELSRSSLARKLRMAPKTLESSIDTLVQTGVVERKQRGVRVLYRLASTPR